MFTTAPELEAWIIAGAMQGMRPWFTKFNSVVSDPRWIEPVAHAFATRRVLRVSRQHRDLDLPTPSGSSGAPAGSP